MTKQTYTSDLLAAAKLAAARENDPFLVYLINMAIERANVAQPVEAQKPN
ncbi:MULTISPECIES: hypothetical protein [unclassified Rhizobium]|nr:MULTISPECIES: hypothetical protein [unclassified Rhizobium]